MDNTLYNDAKQIIDFSIKEVLPGAAVKKALENFKEPKGKTIMIALGKAAYTMAEQTLREVKVDKGLVVTKYAHAKGELENTTIIEAGHPLSDENSIKGANLAVDMCTGLTEDDTVIMLVSGGGSALFEAPLITLDELREVNGQLLRCGANINEINTIRKRLSRVKGGRFAEICKPAKVIDIILSDIINDPLDMIASGPAYPDASTCEDALNIVKKYDLDFNDRIMELLHHDTAKKLDNVETYITGNNEELKLAAKNEATRLGYKVVYIDEAITSEVKDAAKYLQSIIDSHLNDNEDVAIIGGGEIVVEVKGDGLGGRNQELALRCAAYLEDKKACVFAVGSDGTDGPTDAAGGYADRDSFHEDIEEYLNNNDAYHYLEKYGGLIKTGPTGTNVCDLYCALIRK